MRGRKRQRKKNAKKRASSEYEVMLLLAGDFHKWHEWMSSAPSVVDLERVMRRVKLFFPRVNGRTSGWVEPK